MIKEVLRAIHGGGLLSKGEIADQAGVQESTLENILSMLSSKGYLKTVESSIDLPISCISCPIRVGCMTKVQTGNIYIITEKGTKLLENA